MGQQVADRHALLARPLKLGDVTLDRRIEGERALVHEQHARGGEGHHLGQRREIIDRPHLHGVRVVAAVVSHGGQQREATVSPHGEHGAGKRAAVDFRAQVRGGGGEASAVEPEGSGRRGGKAATTRERGPRGSSDRRMAGNGRGYACEDDLPHGCESETITPKPTG